MKTVKLTFPPEHWDINKHSSKNCCSWGNYEFILNQDIKECDFWIVCGNLIHEKETVTVNVGNVIFDTSESADIVNYSREFLSQFSYVSSFRNDMKHPHVIKSVPVIPWFVKKNFDELTLRNTISKTKKISLLASDKKISINHIKRLNFVKKIHNYFGKEIDIYGAGFTEYIYDKTPILDPYMFSIVLETIAVPEYFSEKLGDSYLSLCFPIYYGCSNLSDYFNSKSFEIIDMNNFDKSVKTLIKILNSESLYESRLENIIEAKNIYLNEYSVFPVLGKILNEVELLNKNRSTNKQEVELVKYTQKDIVRKIVNRLQTKSFYLFNRF